MSTIKVGHSSFAAAMIVLLLMSLSLLLFSRNAAAATIITATFPGDSTTTNQGQPVEFRVELNSSVNVSKATVTWYRNNNPVVDPNLNYTYTPDFQTVGTYKITIVILYDVNTARHDWNLTVLKVKQPFSIASVSPTLDIQMRELETRTFSVKVNNPANDTLAYRWYIDDELQLGFISSDYSYVPGLDGSGNRTIRFEVESADHMESHKWSVKVLDALEVNPVGPQTVREGDSLTFKIMAPNLPDSAVRWSLDGSTTQTDKGRSYTYSPDNMASGAHTLKMNTTDGLSYQWNIQVLDVDRAPVTAQGKLISAQVGKAVIFKGVSSDQDNDIVKYEWDFNGDGVYEFVTDREEATTHTYKTAGIYTAVFKVTDAHGETATMTYPVQVTQPSTLSPWVLGSIILCVIIIIVVVWVVYDIRTTRKRARLEAESRAREREEIASRAKAKAQAPKRPVKEELPLFEDIHEPAQAQAQDYSMVPYESKMADQGQEAEEAAADGGIPPKVEGEAAAEAAEGSKVQDKSELDDILKSLGAKSGTKAELTSKKASAEAGAEDIDHELGPHMTKGKKVRPTTKGQQPKKVVKKEPAKDDTKATGKGADSDVEAKGSDEVDMVMQKLVDMGLAERKKKQ